MPQLTIKGTNPEKLMGIYTEVTDILAEAAQIDKKYVKLDFIPTIQFGAEDSFLKLEVLWLKGRSQAVQDDTAQTLTDFFKSKGYSFVQVTFHNLPASDFYEEGVHY